MALEDTQVSREAKKLVKVGEVSRVDIREVAHSEMGSMAGEDMGDGT